MHASLLTYREKRESNDILLQKLIYEICTTSQILRITGYDFEKRHFLHRHPQNTTADIKRLNEMFNFEEIGFK